MGVEHTDERLLDECLAQLNSADVDKRIKETAVEGTKLIAVNTEPVLSLVPELVKPVLNKINYALIESAGSSSFPNAVKNLREIGLAGPFTVVSFRVGVGDFFSSETGKKIKQELGDKVEKVIEPLNELFSEVVIEKCPPLIKPYLGENLLPKISFVILSALNNGTILDEMIESFCKATPAESDIEVICVINGSHDDSAEVPQRYLKNDYHYRVIFLPQNLGIAGGYNQGINIARGKYICLLQDDVIFTQRNWHRELAYYLDLHPEIGVMGGQQARFYFKNDSASHRFFPPYISVGSDEWAPLQNSIVNVDAALCMAVMFRRELGFYDERFLPNGIEDIAFCFEARKKGWKVFATDVGIKHDLHDSSRSATRSPKANSLSFIEKLGRRFRSYFRSRSSSTEDSMKPLYSRLSRAYHFEVFIREYGDMLRPLPYPKNSVNLNYVESFITTLPKNYSHEKHE